MKKQIILEYMASFLKYGVSDNVFVECSKGKKKKIKKIIENLQNDLAKFNAEAIIVKARQGISYYKTLIDGSFKFKFFVIDTDVLSKRDKNVDDVFYFLSRLGEMDERLKEYNVTCMILGENIRDFLRKLIPATLSSMQLRKLEVIERGKKWNQK